MILWMSGTFAVKRLTDVMAITGDVRKTSKNVAFWPIKEKRHQEIDAKNQHTLLWKLKVSLEKIIPLDWTQFLVTTHPHSWHPSAPLVDYKLPRPDVSMSWELKHNLKTPPQSLWQLYGYAEDCMHSFGSSHHFSIHSSESKSFCGWVCMLYPPESWPCQRAFKFWINVPCSLLNVAQLNLTSFLFIRSYCLKFNRELSHFLLRTCDGRTETDLKINQVLPEFLWENYELDQLSVCKYSRGMRHNIK